MPLDYKYVSTDQPDWSVLIRDQPIGWPDVIIRLLVGKCFRREVDLS